MEPGKSTDFFANRILYALASFLILVILKYFVFFRLGLFPYAKDLLGGIRIFVCGPGLVFLGAFLFLLNKRLLHRSFGVVFFLTGAIWIFALLYSLLSESASSPF